MDLSTKGNCVFFFFPEPFMNRNTVLLVIDVQKGFCRPTTTEPKVEAIAQLMRQWIDSGGYVVCTRFINVERSPYETMLGWRKMGRDDPDIEIHDSVKRIMAEAPERSVHVIDKNFYSAVNEPFLSLVHEHRWASVAIAGFSTHACVLKTALDLFERSITPLVVSDVCASHNERPEKPLHAPALSIMAALIGSTKIITSEELMTKRKECT